MQTLNQKKKNSFKIKKSHYLLFGSLLVFLGGVLLAYNHLEDLRGKLFSNMQLAIYNNSSDELDNFKIPDLPFADNLDSDVSEEVVEEEPKPIDYSIYLGVLEIPKIGLKRGFFGTGSRYNNIQYNVTLVEGSAMPDVENGNLILMAHSGDAYISYFAYLYRLNVGDSAFITYNGNSYQYEIVNIYNVDKNGSVKIVRNYDKTVLTLITCTKDDDTKQTIYIAELVS